MSVQSNLVKRSLILLLVGGLMSCSTLADMGIAVPYVGDPPLVNVKDLADKKRGAIVYIKGTVKAYAPFLKSGAYQLQDPSGTIWIRTDGKPPQQGKEVVIKGKLDYQSIPVGSQELGEFYVVELEQLEWTAQTPAPSPPAVIPLAPPAVKPQPKTDFSHDLFFPHKQHQ